MTRVGIVGSAERCMELASRSDLDVCWGVDSADEAVRVAKSNPVDLVVVEGRFEFLTDGVLALRPSVVPRIIVVAESDDSFDWVSRFDTVEVVRDLSGIQPPADVSAPARFSIDEPSSLDGSPDRSLVIGVWGAVGAPGITTAAISLATVSARTGLKTLLCDADSRGSCIAIALGVPDDPPGLAAACRLVSRSELSVEELDRLTTTFSRGDVSFEVLSGLPRASRWAAVGPLQLREVVALARTQFDVIVFDVGFGIEANEWIDEAPQRDGASREILRLADRVVAVGRGDTVGVARLIRALDEVRDIRSDQTLVLNATPPNVARHAVDAIHRFTDHRVALTVPKDSRGGIDDAVSRAAGATSAWTALPILLGLPEPPRRERRWRRR